MEQNPVNIVVALIAMAFVFVGLMQYMASSGKSNEAKRADLFEKWQGERGRANDLQDEKERLLKALETSNDLAKKWKKVAGHFYKLWKEEQAKATVVKETITKQTITTTPPETQ